MVPFTVWTRAEWLRCSSNSSTTTFSSTALQKYGFMPEIASTILFMPLPSIHLPTMPAKFYALCRCIQRSFPLEIRFCWCDRRRRRRNCRCLTFVFFVHKGRQINGANNKNRCALVEVKMLPPDKKQCAASRREYGPTVSEPTPTDRHNQRRCLQEMRKGEGNVIIVN